MLHEVVLRRDGGTVYAASANTLDDKWGADSPLSAESPPLTLDDLENLVRNDVWVSVRAVGVPRVSSSEPRVASGGLGLDAPSGRDRREHGPRRPRPPPVPAW